MGYLSGKTVAERFGWEYSDEELREIAGRVDGLAKEVPQVRVMFNNRSADAPTAARRFRELIGQDPGPAPVEGQAGSCERRRSASPSSPTVAARL